MKAGHSIQALCENLNVAFSSSYEWKYLADRPGPRAVANQALAIGIEAIHKQSRQTYGSPRGVEELRKQGSRHGRKRVAKLMKQRDLCGRQKRRYRVQTTDSNRITPSLQTS